MKSKILIGIGVLSAGAIAWAAEDPVIMTVNGVDVPQSEFEYLYHKNSQQQIQAQPLEEYVEMFKLYKMKVAAAKEEGIDTTAQFKSEMSQYRRELANPYITDSVYLESLIDEAYARSLQEAEANHIMVLKGKNAEENSKAIEKIENIRNALLGGADFEELALNNSDDNSVSMNHGHMGYIAAGRYPHAFETAAFTLQPGEISEIVESPVAYHVLIGGNKRESQGLVMAAHIMKMVPAGATPEEENKIKEAVDSLYMVVVNDPESFSAVAQSESDDRGSARMGGQLGWFGTGQMVPEFSEVAFSIPVGEISKPVRSPYGWHIIKKIDAKGPATREELKPELLTRFADPRDERYKMIRDKQSSNLEKKHRGKKNDKAVVALKNYVANCGVDSAFYTTFGQDNETIFFIEKKQIPVSELVASFNETYMPDSYIGGKLLDEKIDAGYNNALVECEEDWLMINNPDYRNLMNEYEEGSLLYEISLKEVWDKAAQDVPGLENYFVSHKDEYKWKEPKAKGFLIQAKNDSVADAVKARYAELGKDTVFMTLRQEFRNQAIIDRLLAPKGLNKFVDYLMFDGPKPDPTVNYPVYFIIEGRLIEEPEEMADVKGQVTSDYQNQLEKDWIVTLKNKYPVVVNDAVLKKIK